MHKVALEKPPIAIKVANLFGAFGYLSLFMEWVWVFALIFYPLAKNANFMLPHNAPAHPAAAAPLFAPSPVLSLIIGGIVVVACIALVIYGLYTVPRDLAKASSHAAHSVAHKVMPAIIHHKPIGKKQARRLAFATVNWLKLAAIAIPLITYSFVPSFPALEKPIVGVVAFFFATWAAVWFGLQITIAVLAHSDTRSVW